MIGVQGKRVFIGLSGGVDSAVSAALLQGARAEVTGVFIKGWYPPGVSCTWAAERRDAMRVAARLHIPFRTLDASAEYRKGVIDYLISEYRAGCTPNPDVMCNRDVKFGAFHRFAVAHGADFIATGHYRAGEKDQSYFLWAVPKEILATTLFPVGLREKSEVRTLAKRFNIPVAEKKDSQGICFLGSISVEEFLRGEFGVAPGMAHDEEGNIVGQHDGVLLYTIGERIALKKTSASSQAGPWFVLVKNIEKKELVVGKGRCAGGIRQDISFRNANWLSEPHEVTHAQYRYRDSTVRGRIEKDRFISTEPLTEVPAPGQSLVFYENGKLAGGGIITI